MTTKEIANRLIELCSQGEWQQAHDELYSRDAESIEPEGTPWGNVKGMEAIAKKGEQWSAGIEEFHGVEISEPVVADNFFAVRMVSDTTMKGMGRLQFEELAMYQVQDGKIVKEQFFYTPPPQS
ncbi:MAG: SnoaL-like domain-containing protein [Cyclobacteriaceae bacterium]